MRTFHRFVLAPTLAIAALTSAACGGDDASDESTAAKDIEQLRADLVSGDILGLQTRQEDQKATLENAKRSYVDAVGLYSLRREELLQATLQITRFNENADFEDRGFRRSLLDKIGGSAPREVRMGADTVYMTSGTRQKISVWFRGRYLFILSTRDEFEQPRTLLREALEIEP